MHKERFIYIIGTPIGNLEDITYRALRILNEVDVILCENPSIHRKILSYYKIKNKKLLKITSANEVNSINGILKLIDNNRKVALVSDAGTPCLSDPGSKIVRELYKKKVRVIPIPGVSALTTSISISPIPMSKFLFLGFPPKSLLKLKKLLEKYKKVKIPLAFFIPPKKIKNFIELLRSEYPESEIAVFKELTKVNEMVFYGKPSEVNINEDVGEFVIFIKLNS